MVLEHQLSHHVMEGSLDVQEDGGARVLHLFGFPFDTFQVDRGEARLLRWETSELVSGSVGLGDSE